MQNNETIIREFLAAWSRLDADKLVSYFTDDGIYHNMPIAPVQGQAALKAFISNFLRDWTETEWDVRVLISSGDTVVAERIDRTQIGERAVDLPCCGVFEMENGKIKVWRDYFDMATYTREITGG